MKFLVLGILITLCMNALYPQIPNGPGGVGTTNGATSLRLWLDAGDLNGNADYSDNPPPGTPVAVFVDKSGYGYNLSQALSTNRPLYDFSTYPNVYFPDSQLYHKNLNNPVGVNLNPGSLFYVINADNSGHNANVLFDDGVISLRYAQDPFTNKIGFTHYLVNDYITTMPSIYNTYTLCSYHKKSSSTNSLIIKLASGFQTINVDVSDYFPIGQLGKSNISPLGTDDPVNRTAEIIAHNVYLNTAQQKIIENYLSAKFGSFPIPNDIYLMDNPANGDFDFEVAGIGRDNASNLHNDAQGTSIVRILNPSNLDDNEYFIWGHNNLPLTFTSTDVPAGMARMERVWRPTEVGNTGNLTVRFTITSPVAVSQLRLLIDVNNNGVFADEVPIAGATNLGGGVFEFSSIPQFANALRFTVGLYSRLIPAMDSTLVTCNGMDDGSATVTVSGGTPPYTYLWMPGGMTTPTVTGLAPGTYTVSITDSAGLDTSAVVTITEPTVLNTQIYPAGPLCMGDSANITSSTSGGILPYSYIWSNGDTTSNIHVTPAATTNYVMAVTDANGCIDSASTQVVINPLPAISFSSDFQQGCSPFCPVFTQNSSGIATFNWSFGDGTFNDSVTNPTHCYANSGSYNVKLAVTDTNGCKNSITLLNYITVIASPTAQFLSQHPTMESDFIFTNTSTGAAGFHWDFGDGTTSSAENPTHSYADTGTFTVILVAIGNFGCNDTISHTIHIKPQFSIYIPNSFTPGDNNGINDFFLIYGNAIHTFAISIFNRWGEEIFTSSSLSKCWDGKIRQTDAPQGVYVYKIYCTDDSGKEHEYMGQINLLR